MEHIDDKYKKVIRNLKKNPPLIEDSSEFTDKIMNEVSASQFQPYILKKKNLNEISWKIFVGARNAMAVAAVFLIGFFVYQQWEIMDKVSRLEVEIQNQKEISIKIDEIEYSRTARIKQLMEKKLVAGELELPPSQSGKENILLQKSMLNYLLQSLYELEKENSELKERLIRQYKDSSKSVRNENRKTL